MKKTPMEIRKMEIDRLEKIPYNQCPRKGIDSGAYGKALELELTPSRSHKTCISGHNAPDNYCYVDGQREPVEIKSNGGRIGSLLKIENPDYSYIVYKLHLCNSTTGGKMIDIAPRIMTVSAFIAILNECGAIRKNSRDGEPCIQPSKRGLWYLLEMQTEYRPNEKYIRSDIVK